MLNPYEIGKKNKNKPERSIKDEGTNENQIKNLPKEYISWIVFIFSISVILISFVPDHLDFLPKILLGL